MLISEIIKKVLEPIEPLDVIIERINKTANEMADNPMPVVEREHEKDFKRYRAVAAKHLVEIIGKLPNMSDVDKSVWRTAAAYFWAHPSFTDIKMADGKCANFNNSLYIFGPFGAGKKQVMQSLRHAATLPEFSYHTFNNVPIMTISAFEINNFAKNGGNYVDRFVYDQKARVLLITDLDENSRVYSFGNICPIGDIIRTRDQYKKITHVTSKIEDFGEFREVYGNEAAETIINRFAKVYYLANSKY